METYLLGIDIGTTATKAVLLHPARGIVAGAGESLSSLGRPGGPEDQKNSGIPADGPMSDLAGAARKRLPG
jgi:hypothetical protein